MVLSVLAVVLVVCSDNLTGFLVVVVGVVGFLVVVVVVPREQSTKPENIY